MSLTYSLHQLGWRSDYAQSLSLADFEAGYPARVSAVHRSGLMVISSRGEDAVVLPHHIGDGVAVGDWVLLAHDDDRVTRVLPRGTSIERVAEDGQRRLLAANLDVLLIVLSCDSGDTLQLTRYLALADDAGIRPVIVLTWVDRGDEVGNAIAAVEAIATDVAVVAVNGLDAASVSQLDPWLTPGRTVALTGPSRVDNSTLFAALTGHMDNVHALARHANTSRGLLPTPGAAWVVDASDVRELHDAFDDEASDGRSVVSTHAASAADADAASVA